MPKPLQWTLQSSKRPRGVYFQAVYGRPPRRRVVTLGYLSQEDADRQLATLRAHGEKTTTVVLLDGQLVPFSDEIAAQGNPIYDDDAIRLIATCGVETQSWDAFFREQTVKAAVASGSIADLPLADYWRSVWAPVRKVEAAPGTVERETWLWERKLLPVLGGVSVRKIDGVLVERFLVGQTTWGGATKRLALNALRCALKYAVDVGALPALPKLRPVKGSTKRTLPRPVALTAQEATLLLVHAPSPAHRACWAYAMGQGLRPSEATCLDWSDVSWAEQTVRVRGTKTSTSDRLVPLTPATLGELLPYWSKLGSPTTGPAFVWRGKPLGSWKRALDLACDRAGFAPERRVFPNLFRHTFATSAALAGLPKAITKELLGHSARSEMLELAYTNPNPVQVREALAGMTRLGG
ncbi:site-specific integrase [Myxococcota bacterium]|nr:site-specific integrase [Myxococcota bacterium]